MSAKVVGIDGGHVTTEGQPNKHVVAELERMLSEAKAGRLHAIAFAVDTPQGVEWSVTGSAMGFDMIGGLHMAMGRIAGLMCK